MRLVAQRENIFDTDNEKLKERSRTFSRIPIFTLLFSALRTVLPVKLNFASEIPTDFIFSHLVDFANVTLSNA